MTLKYRTKREILKMFTPGTPLTLTDISTGLDLAVSTVSQHLDELQMLGAVEEVERQGTKKWKYYKLNIARAEELCIEWDTKRPNRWTQNYNHGFTWTPRRAYGINKVSMNMNV
jgi:DNA-binding transcriptional ArsR family regulator